MAETTFSIDLEVPLHVIPTSETEPEKLLPELVAQHLKIPEDAITNIEVIKRSLDARRKPRLFFIYRLNVSVRSASPNQKLAQPAVTFNEYELPVPKTNLKNPLIVGTGPAGLFAAYLFARQGCNPIIIDRGVDVDTRHADISSFFNTRQLNSNSNFLFGEGGAGTYSDGKLYTRTKDPRNRYILQTLVDCGAPAEILFLQRPHIGSDILPKVIKKLRQQIIELGGTFSWQQKLKSVVARNNRCVGIQLTTGEQIEAPLVLLAAGHSDRELILHLIESGISYTLKDFQLGCRIEHSQELINKCQYGLSQTPSFLGAAEYNLVSRPKSETLSRVSSFCMCPGGIIIPATNYEGQLSTNGMSNYKRDTGFANSALIVNQNTSHFNDAQSIFSFLAELEKKAFSAGGEDFTCPAQKASDFVRAESNGLKPASSYQLGLTAARLDQLLPPDTARSITEALRFFEKSLHGFMKNGQLIGIETHVSSPVRFTRDPVTQSTSCPGLYIAGEAAGYASGIMSSALDGLRLAETILSQPE